MSQTPPARPKPRLSWSGLRDYDDGSCGGGHTRTLTNHTACLGCLACLVLALLGDLTVTERLDAVLAQVARLGLH